MNADYHFTIRFDGDVGVAYSFVSGGLAIAIPHGPRRALYLPNQRCSDNRCSFRILIVSAAGSVEGSSETCNGLLEQTNLKIQRGYFGGVIVLGAGLGDLRLGSVQLCLA